MGQRERRYVEGFYQRYSGRVAICVGYSQEMAELFPFVLEDGGGKALGIIAMAALTNEEMSTVHIFHFSAFKQWRGDGSKMLRHLCQTADRLSIILSLSPIPSPNGNNRLLDHQQLIAWYRKYGFKGESLLCRPPQTIGSTDEHPVGHHRGKPTVR
jgi:GNAT superfamily N-acetyltransferase